MLSVLGFLIILGPLVIVHEFGHYLFARIFGVKAEVFSVGFGPKLWSRKRGETEWCFSAIPLGGYVKLLGEDRETQLSAEEQKRALHKQAPWKRFFIFFGGPLFNFLFAILVFMAILLIGEPQVASVAGRVVENSPAAKAGFESGDRILSVNGKPVKKFEEIVLNVHESPRKAVDFEVVHPGSEIPVHLFATPTAKSGFSVYGETTHVGEIHGLLPNARNGLIGVSNPESHAGKAGFKTGDQIVSINGTPIANFEQVEAFYRGVTPGGELRLKGRRASKGGEEQFVEATLKKSKAQKMASDWGLHSAELFVERPVPGSPAEKAGLRQGDRLVGVGNITVHSFFELKDAIQKSGEEQGKVQLRIEREGKAISYDLTPVATEGRDPVLNKTTQFTVGVMPMLSAAEPDVIIERTWNPFVLVYRATERMITFSWRNLVSVGKMIKGDVSVNTLGGPILIGVIAGEALARGLIAFLTNMAILSIGLGVLNILPVPVLDGGHLMLLGIESVRGRPLTLRQMEVIQGVGLIVILALMGVVLHNDFSRLASF